MTTVALVSGALVAALAVVYVARPFLREPALDSGDDRFDDLDPEARQALDLAEQRDRALAALKELEFDHRTGKLSDDDYREQIGPLRREAAEALHGLTRPEE
jgi:hypothetical protein